MLINDEEQYVRASFASEAEIEAAYSSLQDSIKAAKDAIQAIQA